jgi:CheY-like chemotaxis protein
MVREIASQELLADESTGVAGAVQLSACVQTGAALATVLVAEDDLAVRDFVSSVLEQEGYKVLVANNGRQSLEICKNHDGPIYALITDVVMPEINGRELAERARLIRPNLKVLFISGYVDRGLREEDTQNPSYAFLEKPFTAESLLTLLGSFRPLARQHCR